jgi:hypothetical protein
MSKSQKRKQERHQETNALRQEARREKNKEKKDNIVLRAANEYPLTREVCVGSGSTSKTLIGKLVYRRIVDLIELPKIFQIRCYGTDAKKSQKKGQAIESDGLKAPLWINSNDEVYDGYTRKMAIEDRAFDLEPNFPNGLPCYLLQGSNHTSDDITELQLALNRDPSEYVGNDKATMEQVLISRLLGSLKNCTPEEQYNECIRITSVGAPADWSSKYIKAFATCVFEESVDNGAQLAARINGHSIGSVCRLLGGQISNGLHPQYAAFVKVTEKGSVFVSGTNDSEKMVKVLKGDKANIQNMFGQSAGQRHTNQKSVASIQDYHFLMFLDSKPAASIVEDRKSGEEYLRDLFSYLDPEFRPRNIRVFWVPQIFEKSGNIPEEYEGTLLPGFGNP